jgi:DNA-binding HxlR family transcriptional regulator
VALAARAAVIAMSMSKSSDDSDVSVIEVPDEPQPLAELTGFQRDILFVLIDLEGTNPNGTCIKTNLREVYGEEINHGRLYQNLRTLVDEELVEKRPVDGRTNAYRVSVVARECLESHAAWSQWCLMEADTDEGA